MPASQRSHCHDKTNSGAVDSSEGVGGKDECQVRLTGYVNLRGGKKRQLRKVGREAEGSSSNRLELAAFVLALRGTHVATPMLYLCDN